MLAYNGDCSSTPVQAQIVRNFKAKTGVTTPDIKVHCGKFIRS